MLLKLVKSITQVIDLMSQLGLHGSIQNVIV
jgi:hypothetical protein